MTLVGTMSGNAKNFELAKKVIAEHPLATLIPDKAVSKHISYIPLLLANESEGHFSLIGHFDKQNPLAHELQENSPITTLFHGPQSYISPAWYVSTHRFPTWHYVNVSITGGLEFLDNQNDLKNLLQKMTTQFESKIQGDWSLKGKDQSMAPLLEKIRAFKITVHDFQVHAKIGDDLSSEDKVSTLKNLYKHNSTLAKFEENL